MITVFKTIYAIGGKLFFEPQYSDKGEAFRKITKKIIRFVLFIFFRDNPPICVDGSHFTMSQPTF